MAARATGLVLFTLALVLTHNLSLFPQLSPFRRPVENAELKALFPSGDRFAKRSTPCPHWEVSKTSQPHRPLGWVILTTETVMVEGYGGPIELLLAINGQGELSNIKMRVHRETASYVDLLFADANIQRLKGSKLADIDRAFLQLDGLSGATVSATTLKRTIKSAMGAWAGQQSPQESVKTQKRSLFTIVLALLVLLLALVSFYGSQPQVRQVAMFTGLLLGFCGVFLSIETMWPILIRGRFLWQNNYAFSLLLIGSLVAAVFRGRIFCSHICPLGSAQETLAWCAKSSGSYGLKRTRYLRFVLLALVVFIAGQVPTITRFTPDPIFLFLTFASEPTAIVLVLSIIVASCFISRLWCRLFCPLGALLALLGIFAPAPVAFHCQQKPNCSLCQQSCPMGAIRAGDDCLTLSSEDCIMCGKCKSCCPKVNDA